MESACLRLYNHSYKICKYTCDITLPPPKYPYFSRLMAQKDTKRWRILTHLVWIESGNGLAPVYTDRHSDGYSSHHFHRSKARKQKLIFFKRLQYWELVFVRTTSYGYSLCFILGPNWFNLVLFQLYSSWYRFLQIIQDAGSVSLCWACSYRNYLSERTHKCFKLMRVEINQ